MQVWRNCQVLSEQTGDSPAFLNAMYLLEVCTQLWTSFFHILIWFNCNQISEGLLYIEKLVKIWASSGGAAYYHHHVKILKVI
jgi:hypothetical protein